jgi:hypothetical protein
MGDRYRGQRVRLGRRKADALLGHADNADSVWCILVTWHAGMVYPERRSTILGNIVIEYVLP